MVRTEHWVEASGWDICSYVEKFLPQRGKRTQPRVSTLGTATQRRALKGRQIERTNNCCPAIADLSGQPLALSGRIRLL